MTQNVTEGDRELEELECFSKGVLRFVKVVSCHHALRSANLLAPFPLHTTFSCSEYYEASAADHRPWWTAPLPIPGSAAHVH